MTENIIEVENLSKQYRLGQISTGTISHDLNRVWHRLRGKPDPYLKVTQANDRTDKANEDYVWALQDINFEVKRGEVLGIIGRNGAGKSTLLKILSRVTAPTTGEIRVDGRIASLLEVGTGFHPELTGRENIFLNGSILGMTKAEIKSKLDEIVDFSGCARYLDTPVKRYSSGMMVRLGFAVAAHLEPEILIVDEVLAVGDAEFQQKCLGKMQDVASSGRTVLFVSHNMGAVRSLCSRAYVLSEGRTSWSGDTEDGIQHYLKSCVQVQNQSIQFVGSGKHLIEFQNLTVNGSARKQGLLPSEEIDVEVTFKIRQAGRYRVYIAFSTEHGARLLTFSTNHREFQAGVHRASFTVEPYLLRSGRFIIGFGGDLDQLSWFWADNISTITIEEVWDAVNVQQNLGLINYQGDYQIQGLS